MPEEKIDIIPHGIPDMPFVDPNFFKDQFGVEGRTVLLTFGLLSPDKGIEYAIEALPEIVQRHPDVVYIVLGATHPNLLAREGERYRLSLERLAEDCGVKEHVIFYNRFVALEELKEFIGAADIYVTPYLNEAQITSGTLAYCFGAGKAVVSTPYWHAQELLADDRGVSCRSAIPARSPTRLRAARQSDAAQCRCARAATCSGREHDLAGSGAALPGVVSTARAPAATCRPRAEPSPVRTLASQPYQLPPLRLDHLFRMSDDTGILQHAVFNVPNFQRRLLHGRQRARLHAHRAARRTRRPAAGDNSTSSAPLPRLPRGTPSIRRPAASATS